MQQIYRSLFLTLLFIGVAIWAVIPPEKTLRLGKDLRGGVSLVYSVQISALENPDEVLQQTMDALKRRVDPDGLMEISMIQQGRDRIEISMPLPSDRVKGLRKKFEDELIKLGRASLTESRVDQAVRIADHAEREKQLHVLSAEDAKRLSLLQSAAAAYDAAVAKRAEYDAATGPAKDALIDAVGNAELEYEKARAMAASTAVSAEEIRKVVTASAKRRSIRDGKKMVELPSAREVAEKKLKEAHPESIAEIDRILGLFNEYAKERTTFDDPQDLIRLLKGAGVLSFRITVNPGHAEESRLRQELRDVGPRNVKSTDMRWFKINQIETWIDSLSEAEFVQASDDNARGFFSARGYVVEPYAGDFYMLAYDTRTSRLTPAEGAWQVDNAYRATDQIGNPAIDFQMNPSGAVMLGQLTGAHVKEQMAVLLDDEVYTAPTLQSQISARGQITGKFSDEEIQYVVRVLKGGSLQAKLVPEPISISSFGPQLGADNLRKGLVSGGLAIVLVAGFMMVYYYGSGMIAVVALVINSILILGCMAMSKAAFTMPGIAGVILTFGQAVDSNVLIYERMREEFHRGADMKTAVRLGFSRALSPIMDGNVSNLVICAVLYYFGTQEIRGFAITLGIGVVTTLFTALVVSRLIFTVLVEHMGWKKTSQLPMTFPRLQKILTPHIDWMKHRNLFLGLLVAFLLGSGVIVYIRGEKMLGTEFRGGTEVELQFKSNPATGQPETMKRAEVHERLAQAAREAPEGSELKALEEAEVMPVNPAADGVTSDRFRIRTGPPQNQGSAEQENRYAQEILTAIAHKFEDKTESQGALTFVGAGSKDWRSHAYQIMAPTIGEAIDRPAVRDDAKQFLGGVAVVIENIEPAPSRESLVARLDRMRQQPEYADTLSRARDLRIIEGTDSQVKTAVLLVRDDAISAFDNAERWETELASREWNLANDALTRTAQIASVQTFSPTIARTFVTQAIMSIVVSLLLLTVYVWIRFGAARWAIAATVPLFADVIGIAGMIGLAEVLYDSPVTGDFARSIGLLPFKFDLAQIAALLTIVGYSLNDKIIILDRIRENKGKLPYATYQIVNDSINQTLSRTLITAGGHLVTTVILYIYGGEAVRGFAFAFNLGVVLGTYTSIVSSPLVWSHKLDPITSPQAQPAAA